MQHEIDRSFLEMLACGDPYLRRNFIGASDAPIIMGVSPWRKPIDLYREKCGLLAPQKENWAMARGNVLEPLARSKFEQMTGHKVFPKRLFSKNYNWMMASLDGLDETGKIAVEIKCPGLTCHREALHGKIPERYYPQLQHQMYVAEIAEINYFSYVDGHAALVVCEFNPEYVEKLIEKEIEFWDSVQKAIEPPSDYNEKDDEYWLTLRDQWNWLQTRKSLMNEEEESLREKIVSACDGENSRGFGMKANKIVKKGSINYQAIPELKDVDFEKYRKEGSEYWKITLEDQENAN